MFLAIKLLVISLCLAHIMADPNSDYTYEMEDTPVTTDISCWMGNSRISPTFSLEKCDYWVTYNATKVPKGSACIVAQYSVDGQKYVYRNCSYSVSSLHDPCEQVLLHASNHRVDMQSCDICWDNGCNLKHRPSDTKGWYWYLLALLLIAFMGFCVAVSYRGLGISKCCF